jgi:hypothetical protein
MKSNKLLIALVLCAAMQPGISFGEQKLQKRIVVLGTILTLGVGMYYRERIMQKISDGMEAGITAFKDWSKDPRVLYEGQSGNVRVQLLRPLPFHSRR